MHPPGGELPRQPAVDRAKGQLAALGTRAGTGDVVEQPFQFGAGKIGIDHQPRSLAEGLGMAVGTQRIAQPGGPPVLPDDRPVQGLAAGAVPEDGRLALVGDADGGEPAGGDAVLVEDAAGNGELRPPDVVGVVLDPSRLRVVLRVLLLRDTADRAVTSEKDRA